MRESYLLNDIIKALYPAVKLWRANVGCVKTIDGRYFKTGLPNGFPDLFGVLPDNMAKSGCAVPVFIEVKVHPNTPSDEQEAFIAEQKLKGAATGVAYSVDDAWGIILPYMKDKMG